MIRILISAALVTVAWSSVNAQSAAGAPPLKRQALAAVARPICSSSTSPAASPSDAARQQARDAAARAQQAAILGDTAAALAGLIDAKRLDPTDADVAYRLARLYENAHSTGNAVSELCRFLALKPGAADAADARARLSSIATPNLDPAIEAANTSFRNGLSAFDAGRTVDAEAQFTKAIEVQPSWADAIYDRGLARSAQGDREGAANDLALYLRIDGGASDRASVLAQIDALRAEPSETVQYSPFSPGRALVMGLIVPGAGQFYTHRSVRGIAFLITAGAALGSAFVSERTTSTTSGTDRPYLVPGLAVGVGTTLMGAIEAAVYADKSNERRGHLSMVVAPSRGALGLRVAF